MLTLWEVKQRIKERYDPDTVLELLDLSTEQLVDRFEDIIEDRYDLIEAEVSLETEDEV